MSGIEICPCCGCRNGKHLMWCGKCGWELGRRYSLEIELEMMGKKDPKLKALAERVDQAAKNLGLTGQES